MRKGLLLGAAVILAVVGGKQVFGQATPRDLAKSRGNKLRELLRSAQGADEQPARTMRTADGYLRALCAPAGEYFEVEGINDGQPAAIGERFLEQWRDLVMGASPAMSLRKIRQTQHRDRHVLRYQQTFADIEVFGAQVVLQVGRSGGVEYLASRLMRDTSRLETDPTAMMAALDAVAARRRAETWLEEEYPGYAFQSSEPKQIIFAPDLYDVQGDPLLAWYVEVREFKGLPVGDAVVIDARTGEIVFYYSLFKHAFEYEIDDRYDGNPDVDYDNLASPPGRPLPTSSDPADVWLLSQYLEETYNYFNQERFGYWKGLNGTDSIISTSVRVPGVACPYGALDNMQFGTGVVLDDVVGHEYVHNIVDATCNLTGSGEPGAIEESFADMFGEWIDQSNETHRSNGAIVSEESDPWIIMEDDESVDDYGEPCPGVPEDWLRDMSDPKRTYDDNPDHNHDPDTYQGVYWVDGGGVHSNNGVGNKLAYLLTVGASHNDIEVDSLGATKTSELFFNSLDLMVPSSKYYDLYFALARAAMNIGLTAVEQANVERACRAVNIYSGNAVFSIQDSSGVRVAWFDDVGNLFLAGRARAFQNGQEAAIEAHWKLDETTGPTAADSVGSNHGTLVGSPQWVTGTVDGALDFDGEGDKVTLSAITALAGSSSVTISAWIKGYNANDQYWPIVNQYQYDSGYHGYDLSVYDYPGFFLDDSGAQASTAISCEEWHHLVGTYDGTNLRIYVDGEEMDTQAFASGSGNNTSACMGFGSDYGTPSYFEGTIDDVRVYNYALNEKELRHLSSPPGQTVFRIENSSDETVARFDSLGSLFLKGSQQTTWADPSAESDNFIISDSSDEDEPVAYIDDSGDLYLKGKLYE